MKIKPLYCIAQCTACLVLATGVQSQEPPDSTRYVMPSEWPSLQQEWKYKAKQDSADLARLKRNRQKITSEIESFINNPTLKYGLYLETVRAQIEWDEEVVKKFSPSTLVDGTDIRSNITKLVNSLAAPIVSGYENMGGKVPAVGSLALAISELSEAQQKGDNRQMLSALLKVYSTPLEDPAIRDLAGLPSSVLTESRAARAALDSLERPDQGQYALVHLTEISRQTLSLANSVAAILPVLKTDPQYQAAFLLLGVMTHPDYFSEARKASDELLGSLDLIHKKVETYTQAKTSLLALKPEYDRLLASGPTQANALALARLYTSDTLALTDLDEAIARNSSELAAAEILIAEFGREDQKLQDAASAILRRWRQENHDNLDSEITLKQALIRDQRLARERAIAAEKAFWRSVANAPIYILLAPFELLNWLDEASPSDSPSQGSSHSSHSSSSEDHGQHWHTDSSSYSALGWFE